ncbi:glycyl-radical enzyme activating protein [Sediminispirochaeta smaragdinae]|uniref:Glycyl-radical enzyme activating protein family n=1 Tax=Sediminispirochaeta smaragdinae (strain DSM 11293 / JCM 15392 / SEBR 4228) TaxID=573413 RepID=E1RA92_SEDSS|nr:glycyl-radical enzyme activating protein [Sediminispirochaeta smaragdinae]ADK79383.1 glycyl-radical enzyme activating protein family [Sediminispirochaeta smaragdinae DSM 11293]
MAENLTIFELERYALEDGPGIRTVVFFKGCNLHCLWCQNPESQQRRPQVLYYRKQCVGCGKCIETCPAGAIDTASDLGFVTIHDRCTLCASCVDACFYNARRIAGEVRSSEDIMREIMKDQSFYENSGGGVTFSGGEPLLQIEGLVDLASRCRSEGIHTALETAGSVPWDRFERIFPYMNLIYFDVKHIDPLVHERVVGAPNGVILNNLIRLSREFEPVIVRIPVIPGVNDSPEVIGDICSFLSTRTRVRKVELLPFHRLGSGKYAALGREDSMEGVPSLDKAACLPLAGLGKRFGLDITVGAGH